MKSPAELKMFFRRRWEAATTREACLLGGADAWPLVASIGRPAASLVTSDLGAIKRHIEDWRSVNIGEVSWEAVQYRSTAGPIDVPVEWRIRNAAEWVAACGDRSIRAEFDAISMFLAQTEACFHSILVGRRSLWRDKTVHEVLKACRVAFSLTPHCADNKPLRAFSFEGIDTKFFERNTPLVSALLDVRFDGEVSKIGLEAFLGAASDGDHWLLVTDLDGSLLPFRKLRTRSAELKQKPLPGKRLLIVENESCQHHLPNLPETIAVLGAGFDLDWLDGDWLQSREIGYWGDIDTWGLQFLGTARQRLPHLAALLMTQEIYDQNRRAAVPEPNVASTNAPRGLTCDEQALYERLLTEPRGRLEQEFLPLDVASAAIRKWGEG